MAITCTSVGDGSTSPAPSSSKTCSLLYCGMTVGHRFTSRSSTLPPAARSTRTTVRLIVVSSPCPCGAKEFCSDPEEVPPQSKVFGEHSRETQNVPTMSQATIVLFVISLFLCETKNVSVDFERARDYKKRRMVELQMVG
jgi:hypothetical protein